MIKVVIPKEINEYETKPFLNLSARQLIFLSIAVVVTMPTFLLLVLGIKLNYVLASFFVIIEAVPLTALGFVKIKKMPFEKWLIIKIKNTYGQKKMPYITKMEEKNNVNNKEKERINEYRYYEKNIFTTSRKYERRTIVLARKRIRETKKWIKKERRAEAKCLKKQLKIKINH